MLSFVIKLTFLLHGVKCNNLYKPLNIAGKSTSVIKEHNSVTLQRCIGFCESDKKCASINFNMKTFHCELSDEIIDDEDSVDSDDNQEWKHFKKTPLKTKSECGKKPSTTPVSENENLSTNNDLSSTLKPSSTHSNSMDKSSTKITSEASDGKGIETTEDRKIETTQSVTLKEETTKHITTPTTSETTRVSSTEQLNSEVSMKPTTEKSTQQDTAVHTSSEIPPTTSSEHQLDFSTSPSFSTVDEMKFTGKYTEAKVFDITLKKGGFTFCSKFNIANHANQTDYIYLFSLVGETNGNRQDCEYFNIRFRDSVKVRMASQQAKIIDGGGKGLKLATGANYTACFLWKDNEKVRLMIHNDENEYKLDEKLRPDGDKLSFKKLVLGQGYIFVKKSGNQEDVCQFDVNKTNDFTFRGSIYSFFIWDRGFDSTQNLIKKMMTEIENKT